MSTLERTFQQGIAQGIVQGKAKGKAEGKAEGKADTLLRLLTRRFGALDAATTARVRHADTPALDAWLDRVLDAASLDEVFDGGRDAD